MITYRKGLSTVVTTLIIILLVLVAIGIVWVVVRGLIGNTSTQIDIQQKCIGIDLTIDSASCTANVAPATGYTCTATVRKIGGENPDGIRVFLSNSAGTITNAQKDTTPPISLLNTATGIPASTLPTKAEAVAYFNDANGNPNFCTQTAEKNI